MARGGAAQRPGAAAADPWCREHGSLDERGGEAVVVVVVKGGGGDAPRLVLKGR